MAALPPPAARPRRRLPRSTRRRRSSARPRPFPVAIAPMAVHGLAHPDGEVGDGPRRGGGRRPVHALDDVEPLDRGGRGRLLRTASAGSSCTPRPIRAEAGPSSSGPPAAGYSAIVLTVDLPVLGYRERDRRSAFDSRRRSGTSTAPLRADPRRPRRRRRLRDPRRRSRPPDLGRPRDDPRAGRACRSCSRAS